jgi:sulfopyruvate decarboxylase subunit alpha
MAEARGIIDEMLSIGVTDVVYLPDNASKALLELLAAQSVIKLRLVTREGEAWALASGLWVGGRTPLLLIQNTGLLESGDALRGTALRMRIPLVCLITYRGYSGLKAASITTPPDAPDGALLGRPDLDSVALLTEPTLRAWGVPYEFLHTDADLSQIGTAFKRALEMEQPVAVLITSDTTC